MMDFCTLFDSNYLNRGLVLYDSLCKVCDEFKLYVVTFDNLAYDKLTSLNLESLVVERLVDFETPELLAVKPSRSRAEYCWTCGPSVIWHFIEKYKLDSCTYLDADLMFYRSPQLLFDEIGDNSVAITDHYASYHIPQGRYCVQFMYFRNDEWGKKALKWWRDSCIDWCYARREGDKYGDQKYLEQFPIKFHNVHIIKTRGAGIASWNMKQYSFTQDDWSFLFKGAKIDIVFVHYHALGIDIKNGQLTLKPATFEIKSEEKFMFDYYSQQIINVSRKYMGDEIESVHYKSRSLFKKYYALLKFKLRDVKLVIFLYEKYFRSEYKGYD